MASSMMGGARSPQCFRSGGLAPPIVEQICCSPCRGCGSVSRARSSRAQARAQRSTHVFGTVRNAVESMEAVTCQPAMCKTRSAVATRCSPSPRSCSRPVRPLIMRTASSDSARRRAWFVSPAAAPVRSSCAPLCTSHSPRPFQRDSGIIGELAPCPLSTLPPTDASAEKVVRAGHCYSAA